jgi:hypothetical protein
MPVSSQTGPSGRDIIFNLRIVDHPGNAAEGRKFSGGARGGGGGGGGSGGGRPGSSGDDARKAREEEREAERVHKRHRERQLERAKRNREAKDQEIADAKRAADAIDREEERAHRRNRQRQLERARANRALREQEEADVRTSAVRAHTQAQQASQARMRSFSAAQAARSAQRRQGLSMTSESLMQVGGGLAHLGLVGEKDSDALLNGLLMIHGGVGLARGASTLGGGMSSLAGSYGMAAGGSAAAVGAAAVAALASVTIALKSLHEVSTGTAGGVNSVTSTIGRFKEYSQRGMSWIAGGPAPTGQVYTQAYNAEQRSRTMEKNRASMLDQQARSEGFGAIHAAGDTTLFEARMKGLRAHAGTFSGSEAILRERMGLHDAAQAEEVKQRTGKTDAEREAAAQRLLQIQERMTELTEHSRDVSHQEAQEKMRAARESLTATTTELEKRKELMKSIEEKTMSAAERFGNMSEEDQEKTLRAGRIAGQAMTARRRGLTRLADNLIKGLSKEDRERLSATGLESASAIARESAVAEAERKGFFKDFAVDERAKFATEAEIARKLEVRLKREEEVIVKIEDNTEEVARQVANAVRVDNERRYALIQQRVQEDLDRQKIEFNRQLNIARRGAPGG